MLRDSPAVSVIICAYKTGEKIRKTIQAVLAQDFADLELIVIDDASGDDTPDIVKSIEDKRLRFVANEKNLGVVESRNVGLKLARGRYIATCDHDDVWRPSKLSAQVAYMEAHPACGVVGTGWLLHREDGTTLSTAVQSAGPGMLKWMLLHRNSLLHSSLMMRRSVIETHSIRYHSGMRFADDWQIVWQFAKVGDIGLLPAVHVDYYLHGENWSLKRTDEMHVNGTKNIQILLGDVLGHEVSFEQASTYFEAVVLGRSCPNQGALFEVGHLVEVLSEKLARQEAAEAEAIQKAAAALWWRIVRAYAAQNGRKALRLYEKTELGIRNRIGSPERLISTFKSMFRHWQFRQRKSRNRGDEDRILIVASHFRPLVGGAQTVYGELASVRPDRFGVLTAREDYVTGKVVAGIEDYDAKVPFKVHRLDAMRAPLAIGAGWKFYRKLLTNLTEMRVRRQVFKTTRSLWRQNAYSTICIGALDALGWLVKPLKKYTNATVVLYVHGEEVTQKAYRSRVEAARKSALKAADGVVVVSRFTADVVETKYGVSAERILTLANGVNVERFSVRPDNKIRTRFGLSEGPLLLAVGRLVARKGFDRLVEAWPQILSRVPGAQLAIVGEGPLADDLRERLKVKDVADSVRMLGHVDDALLPLLYAAADLFVMPNRTMPDGDTEGFGLVFLEAAAAGIPSVGGRAGGAVDAIIDGKTGFLVNGENVSDIADAVSELLLDDELRSAMGHAARQHAHSQTWENKAEQLLAWVEQISAKENTLGKE